MTDSKPIDHRRRRAPASWSRRRVCQAPLAAAFTFGPLGKALAQGAYPDAPKAAPAKPAATPPAAAATAAADNSTITAVKASGDRIALLIGNQEYPGGHDLPPIHKNVRDMKAALEKRAFTVMDGVDLDRGASTQLIDAFAQKVQALPPDGVALFYFTGHGIQIDAENLLVAARIDPEPRNAAASEQIVKGSVVLFADVMARLPKRPGGLTVAVVDACRTSIRAAVLGNDGLNQVEAPAGCLIAFSTGAGKPALAPSDEKRNTFYTESLVKLLNTASDEISFSDLFRLVKLDVQKTMLGHPVEAVRKLAQFPFIAENVQLAVPLAPRAAVAAAAASGKTRFASADEETDFKRLSQSVWAPETYKLADQFLQQYPNSRLAGSALVARDGAADAARILQRNDIRLYRSSFQAQPDLGEAYAADVIKAGRGDKDAAARIGQRWRTSDASGPNASRYEGWMQYAAELGNGIASYDVALHYRRIDQPQPAARWETRARELGYTPPPTLDQQRK